MKRTIPLVNDGLQIAELVLLGGSGDGQELPRRPDGGWPPAIHSTTGEIWAPVHPAQVSQRGLRIYKITGPEAATENQ